MNRFNFSFFGEAKKIACSGNIIQNLILVLSDNKSEVRSAAAGALMRYILSDSFQYFHSC